VLDRQAMRGCSTPIRGIADLGVWTDDFNNLYEELK
jgi:hypothetical protein